MITYWQSWCSSLSVTTSSRSYFSWVLLGSSYFFSLRPAKIQRGLDTLDLLWQRWSPLLPLLNHRLFFLCWWWRLPVGLLFRYYFLPFSLQRMVSRSILSVGRAVSQWSPKWSCRCGAHSHVERRFSHLEIWRGRRHLGCLTTSHTICCRYNCLLLLLLVSPLCGLTYVVPSYL